MSAASKDPAQRRRHLHRILLLVVTAIYTVLYAGAFFGWGPMQLMLEDNGAFESRCKENEETPCPAQTSRLLNVQLIAQLTLIFSPLVGAFVDAFGTFRLMLCTAICAWAGLSCLTIATGQHLDNLLFLTFILIGFTTVACHIVIVQTGLVFEGVTRQRVLSALNSLFDAGALVYLALSAIQNATGAPLEVIAASYLGVAVVVFGSAVYLWYVVVPVREEKAMQEATSDNSNDPSLSRGTATEPLDESIADPSLKSPKHGVSSNGPVAKPRGTLNLSSDLEARTAVPAEDTCSVKPSASPGYVLISERSAAKQLRSKQFLLLVIFFAFHATSNVFTLTTARDFLAYLGDDETGNRYLTIFTLMTPASILGLPFVDWVLNHHGYHAGLQSINVLALIHGIIKVSSENLNVQVLGFVVFSFFRCFMFTVSFGILPTFLSLRVVGKASGLLTCSQGVTSFVNIPLANLAINQFGGNFFVPNLIYTIGILPCFFLAWMMGKGIQKEEQAKRLLAVEKNEGSLGSCHDDELR